MRIREDIVEAIKKGLPVVALESTIISHGMPYPDNVNCAYSVEDAIIEEGVIPATIGIIDGEIVVGMTREEIEEFGKREGIAKCSRRDLPIILARKEWGATTVSATMIIARMAKIEFFVTGGIGGVHRDGNNTFDISADLDELGKTNVSVICAGPKAILDLNLTTEYLETKGVPILVYQADFLPAFYSKESDIKAEYRVDSPLEIAKIIKEKRSLALDGGVLICNPVSEEYSLSNDLINKVILSAMEEMKTLGIKGKETTPFLLSKIGELTKGQSLKTNVELILSNAHLGAKIAKEYHK
ncbi:MAG TPA: pseudouridine-5'-phosphate glycosidase [Candidatus Onthovivens sp.]|nr:pseudouridine-5'-phosphate glycosidase [Candidatus Onthovivens sp.]